LAATCGGLYYFAILVVINFVVVTKGALSSAEVVLLRWMQYPANKWPWTLTNADLIGARRAGIARLRYRKANN
jgi:hypothetical protein